MESIYLHNVLDTHRALGNYHYNFDDAALEMTKIGKMDRLDCH